ncbi:HD domain-containing protein, partial [candidate division WOR-3 bacterium]|nr:HD domain-containing protein [candidate division WOR-3 bacterium]
LLDRTGLLAALLPEVAALKGVDQGTRYHVKDAWGHTLDVLAAVRPDLELRLAALLHDIGKPATRSETDTGVHFYGHEAESAGLAGRRLRRLGFANLTTRNVKKLIRHHMYFLTDPTRRQVRRMRARFESDELVIKLAELRHADRLAHRDPEDTDLVPKVRELLATDESTGVRPRSPLTGKDVMDAFGIPPGPEVGRLLRAADEIYFTNPGLDRDSLLTALKGTR